MDPMARPGLSVQAPFWSGWLSWWFSWEQNPNHWFNYGCCVCFLFFFKYDWLTKTNFLWVCFAPIPKRWWNKIHESPSPCRSEKEKWLRFRQHHRHGDLVEDLGRRVDHSIVESRAAKVWMCELQLLIRHFISSGLVVVEKGVTAANNKNIAKVFWFRQKSQLKHFGGLGFSQKMQRKILQLGNNSESWGSLQHSCVEGGVSSPVPGWKLRYVWRTLQKFSAQCCITGQPKKTLDLGLKVLKHRVKKSAASLETGLRGSNKFGRGLVWSVACLNIFFGQNA